VFTQASIGIMLFVAVGMLLKKDANFKPAVLVATALCAIALFASLFHLGQPLSALNALAGFDSSWLSREIWATGIFFGFTFLAALVLFSKPQAKGPVSLFSVIAAVVGLFDVFAMASIYYVTAIPAWQSPAWFIEFFAVAVSVGGALFLVLSRREATAGLKKLLYLAIAIAVVLQVAAVVPSYAALGTTGSAPVLASLELLHHAAAIHVLKWVLVLGGAFYLFYLVALKDEGMVSGANLGIVAASLFIGQYLGRYLFYEIMVISSTGLPM